MKIKFNPIGNISILQNKKLITNKKNLFTEYGLGQTYRSGKNIILDTSNGGIFKYLHVGDGIVEITPQSIGLSSPLETAARTSSTLSYRTDSESGIRYAIFTTVWELPSGLDGITEFCMSDNVNPTLGMLCGKSVSSPIELDPAYSTTIRYMVQIPIISVIKTLDSGSINIGGTNYSYTVEGQFHTEHATQLATVFPVETPMLVSGNLSRIYVNSSLWPNGKSKYKCDVDSSENNVIYYIHTGIVDTNETTVVTNISFANSNPSGTDNEDFPLRIVFQTSPTKPVNLDMNFFVDLIIEVENG